MSNPAMTGVQITLVIYIFGAIMAGTGAVAVYVDRYEHGKLGCRQAWSLCLAATFAWPLVLLGLFLEGLYLLCGGDDKAKGPRDAI